MDRINELLELGVDNLDADQLAELRQLLTDEFTAANEAVRSPESVARMGEIADHIDAVNEQQAARDAELAELEARAAELAARVAPAETADTEAAGEGTEVEGESEATEGEITEVEAGTVDADAEAAPVPEPIAAAAEPPAPARPTRLAPPPPSMRPRPRASDGPLSIVAAGDVPGFSAGQRMPSARAVGAAFADKVSALMGAKRGASYPVARFSYEYPTDRYLRSGGEDGHSNGNLIGEQLGLTAAGGLCAPVAASYSFANISTASRPVRDALVQFGADRGGIRFITPPQLSDLASGVTVWTEANDTTPSNPATKPCVTITCGTPTEVVVDAIPLCIKVGNFSRRTFPEQFATWYDLGLAQHARVAEGNLLDGIATASTAVSDGPNLGAARDLLESWDRIAAAYRSRHRMGATAPLQHLTPTWVRNAAVADLIRQLPGDQTFGSAARQFDGALNEIGLNVGYYLDTEAGAGQVFGAQPVDAALPWPATVVSYMFHPGAFLFLDGGTLDLGVDIRDSDLISTNDVQAFVETFEAVAFTGIESLKITNEICVSGASAATDDVVCDTGTGGS